MKYLLVIILSSLSFSAFSTTFYIDPLNGSIENDGSQFKPWRTLQEVIEDKLIESNRWSEPYSTESHLIDVNPGAPIKSGDTIILMSGYHGTIHLERYTNTDDIVVKAGLNQTPTISSIYLRSSARWIFSGLSISSTYLPQGEVKTATLIDVKSHSWRGPSSDIKVIGNDLFSTDDVSTWSVDDWNTLSSNGINLEASNSIAANNTLTNVKFGITSTYDYAYVYGNSIINFSGDAIRGLGNYSEYSNNFIANAFDVSANHDDGFQSWSRNGSPVIGVILRNNRFITDYNHPNPELLSLFQGIGAFDGFYHDWLIENNTLQLEHYHGISLYGARNCTIINNTVIDFNNDKKIVPWIKINPHKNGTHGEGNIVRNNIGRLSILDSATVRDHNLYPQHEEFSDYFEDYTNFNLNLRDGSPAFGAGSLRKAPVVDIEGNPRVRRVDIGAYQDSAL